MLVYFFWYIAGETIAEKMVGKIMKGKGEYIMMGALIHVLVSFVFYTLIGKLIWKSDWVKTIKAHIIWVGLNATILIILMFAMAKQLKGMV